MSRRNRRPILTLFALSLLTSPLASNPTQRVEFRNSSYAVDLTWQADGPGGPEEFTYANGVPIANGVFLYGEGTFANFPSQETYGAGGPRIPFIQDSRIPQFPGASYVAQFLTLSPEAFMELAYIYGAGEVLYFIAMNINSQEDSLLNPDQIEQQVDENLTTEVYTGTTDLDQEVSKFNYSQSTDSFGTTTDHLTSMSINDQPFLGIQRTDNPSALFSGDKKPLNLLTIKDSATISEAINITSEIFPAQDGRVVPKTIFIENTDHRLTPQPNPDTEVVVTYNSTTQPTLASQIDFHTTSNRSRRGGTPFSRWNFTYEGDVPSTLAITDLPGGTVTTYSFTYVDAAFAPGSKVLKRIDVDEPGGGGASLLADSTFTTINEPPSFASHFINYFYDPDDLFPDYAATATGEHFLYIKNDNGFPIAHLYFHTRSGCTVFFYSLRDDSKIRAMAGIRTAYRSGDVQGITAVHAYEYDAAGNLIASVKSDPFFSGFRYLYDGNDYPFAIVDMATGGTIHRVLGQLPGMQGQRVLFDRGANMAIFEGDLIPPQPFFPAVEPTPSPTPSPTASPSPSASPTATATASPTPTASPSPTTTATPTATATVTASPSPSPSPTSTASPTPSPTASPSGSPTPSPSPTPPQSDSLSVILGNTAPSGGADSNADGTIDAADVVFDP